MIVEELIFDGKLIKRYSDAGFLIRQDQTGIDYPEAIDVVNAPYTYTETDIPIEQPEPEEPDDPTPPEPDDPTPDDPDDPEPPEPDEPEPPEESDDDLLSIYEAYDMLLGDD